MPIFENLNDFFSSLQNAKPILALDIGDKTIGLSISDALYLTASTLKTYKRKKFTQDAIFLDNINKDYDISGWVVGLPIELDGKEGRRCQSVRQFVRNYLKQNDIPVYFQDERFSTVEAERILIEADLSRKRRKEVIDSTASTIILQTALDSKK